MIYASSCSSCLHLHHNGRECDAYPNGIPREILSGRHNHLTAFPGDGGVQFQDRFAPPSMNEEDVLAIAAEAELGKRSSVSKSGAVSLRVRTTKEFK